MNNTYTNTALPSTQPATAFLAEAQRMIDIVVRTLPGDRSRFVDERDIHTHHACHTVDLDAPGDVFDGEGVYAVRVFDARTRVHGAHYVAARAFISHMQTDLRRAVLEFRRILPIVEIRVRRYGRVAKQTLCFAGFTFNRFAMRAWKKYVAWCAPRVVKDGDAAVEIVSTVHSLPEECREHSFDNCAVAHHASCGEQEVRYANLPLWWYGEKSHSQVLRDDEAASRSIGHEGLGGVHTPMLNFEEEPVTVTSTAFAPQAVSGVCRIEHPHPERPSLLHSGDEDSKSISFRPAVRMLRVWECACTRTLCALIGGPTRVY